MNLEDLVSLAKDAQEEFYELRGKCYSLEKDIEILKEKLVYAKDELTEAEEEINKLNRM